MYNLNFTPEENMGIFFHYADSVDSMKKLLFKELDTDTDDIFIPQKIWKNYLLLTTKQKLGKF